MLDSAPELLHDADALDAEVRALVAGERLADPYPILNALRETTAVYPIGPAVLISRYADVFDVLTNVERYSPEVFVRGSRAMEIKESFSPEGQGVWEALADRERMHISRATKERHAARRGAVHRYFTPRRILAIEDTIRGFVDELFAEAEEQEVYDQKWLAAELALRVMSDIVGCPQVDREYLRKTVEVRARGIGSSDEQIVRDAYAAHGELDAYIRDVVIAEQRRNQASDLAASLTAAEDDESLSTEEVVGAVINLIIGGLHTTAGLLTIGLFELMRNRDEWTALCADPGLVPDGVEELLRFVSPVQLTQRIAEYDFTWDGVEIPAEMTLIVAVAAANRDPRVFESPNILDIRRSPTHLGLGQGDHYCLGASVIRSEARMFFSALVTRYPDIELAIDPAEIDWAGGNQNMRGVRSLPMRLGARAR